MLSCKNVPCQHCAHGPRWWPGHQWSLYTTYTTDNPDLVQPVHLLSAVPLWCRYQTWRRCLMFITQLFMMFIDSSYSHLETNTTFSSQRKLFSNSRLLCCSALHLRICTRAVSHLSLNSHTTNKSMKWWIWRVYVMSNIASRSDRSIVSIQSTLAGED